MKIICSNCRKGLGEGEPIADYQLGHDICLECSEYFQKKWHGMVLSNYLDSFDVPMMVISDDVRVMAYNQAYFKAFCAGKEKPKGLLGGEFLGCVNSHLPEGCGKSSLCPDCGIRRAIVETLKSNRPQERVPVVLKTIVKGKLTEMKLEISTAKVGQTVQVTVYTPQ
jgi:hypothetical protein